MADTPITTGTAPLPVDPPSLQDRAPALPPVTTGTSAHYIRGLASAVSRASATDPLTVAFQTEKLPPGQSAADLDLPALQRIVYNSATTRLDAKLAAGAFIVEAGGFAAVACWEPGRVGLPHRTAKEDLVERPLFAEFLRKVSDTMQEHLYPIVERVSNGRYWKLSLMARDPGVEYVPGAVRAVLVPFIERFTSNENEGGPMPVWLEAGSEQARAVYAHFGFREVSEMDIRGIKTWGMIYTGNIDIGNGDR
ncbi:hypothetical protein F5Y04DRAFT_221627 [Hypomontagnella monticulosa]|nr:hypothetical protein F5Y04DRAFT_221627 [Hypomontagnella monticulosa]